MEITNEKKETYCQSCGMPLTSDEVLGSNKDGRKNQEYCVYCYKDGEFTTEETMEEMIESCLKHGGDSGIFADKDQAKKMMQEWFPTLKRWRNN